MFHSHKTYVLGRPEDIILSLSRKMMKICLYLGVLIPIDWSDEVEQDIEHNILQTEDYIIVELFGSHPRLI